jgi:hypothetical protein
LQTELTPTDETCLASMNKMLATKTKLNFIFYSTDLIYLASNLKDFSFLLLLAIAFSHRTIILKQKAKSKKQYICCTLGMEVLTVSLDSLYRIKIEIDY